MGFSVRREKKLAALAPTPGPSRKSGRGECGAPVGTTPGNRYLAQTNQGFAMNTIIQILLYLLTILWWIIIIQAVLSWLIAFNVINTHNDFVRNVWTTLERITDPIYRPIRRVLPDFGALDLSPIVVLIIIQVLDIALRNQISYALPA